jgi:hypothetical protein
VLVYGPLPSARGFLYKQNASYKYSVRIPKVRKAIALCGICGLPKGSGKVSKGNPTSEFGAVTIPKSYRQALNSPQADYWREAIAKELGRLLQLGTMKLVPATSMPSGANLMHCNPRKARRNKRHRNRRRLQTAKAERTPTNGVNRPSGVKTAKAERTPTDIIKRPSGVIISIGNYTPTASRHSVFSFYSHAPLYGSSIYANIIGRCTPCMVMDLA